MAKKEEDRSEEHILSAGCANNFTVIVRYNGQAYMWGRGEYWPYEFDQLKKFSRPFPACDETIKVKSVSVGRSHSMFVDNRGQIWGSGDNRNGCLGIGDAKRRCHLTQVTYFRNKRVIDVACGDAFTVVIAELYNLNDEQEMRYFDVSKNNLNAKISKVQQKMNQQEQKLYSLKMDINTARESICGQKYRIPKEVKLKINQILQKRKKSVPVEENDILSYRSVNDNTT